MSFSQSPFRTPKSEESRAEESRAEESRAEESRAEDQHLSQAVYEICASVYAQHKTPSFEQMWSDAQEQVHMRSSHSQKVYVQSKKMRAQGVQLLLGVGCVIIILISFIPTASTLFIQPSSIPTSSIPTSSIPTSSIPTSSIPTSSIPTPSSSPSSLALESELLVTLWSAPSDFLIQADFGEHFESERDAWEEDPLWFDPLLFDLKSD